MSKLSKKNSYKIKKRIQNKKRYTIKNKHSGGAFGRVSDSPGQRIGNVVGRISQSAPQMSNIAKRTLNQTYEYGKHAGETILPIVEKGLHGASNIFGKLVDGVKHTLEPHEYKFKDYENSQQYFENIKLSQPKISNNYCFYTILELPEKEIHICRKTDVKLNDKLESIHDNDDDDDELLLIDPVNNGNDSESVQNASGGGANCKNEKKLKVGDFVVIDQNKIHSNEHSDLYSIINTNKLSEENIALNKKKFVKKVFSDLYKSFTNEEGVGRKVIVGIRPTSTTVIDKTVELSKNAFAQLYQSIRESLHTYNFEDFSKIDKEKLKLKKTKEDEEGTYFKVVSGFDTIHICEKQKYLQDSFNVDDEKPEYLQGSVGGGKNPTCKNQTNLEKGDILYFNFKKLKINDKDEHSLSDLLDSGLPEDKISVFKKSQFKEAIKTLGNFLLSPGKNLVKGAISGVKTVASKLTRKKNSNNKQKKSRKFGFHLPNFRRRTQNNSIIENKSDQPEQNDGSRNNNISPRTNNNSGNGVNTNINRNNRNKRSKLRRGINKIGSSTKKGFGKLIPEKKLYVNVLQYDFGNETDSSIISTKEKELHDMILKFCGNRNEITALFVRNYNNHNQTSIMNTEKVYFNSDSDPTTNNRQYALKIVASSNFSVEEEQNDIMGLVIKVSKNNKFVNFELSNDDDSVSNTVSNTVRVNRIYGTFESNIQEQNKLDVQLNDNQYKRYSINSPNKDGVGYGVGAVLRGVGAIATAL